MKVNSKLVTETYSAGKRFQELFSKLLKSLSKTLESEGISLSFIESELVTLADNYDKKEYGEDILFKFYAYKPKEKKILTVLKK